MSAKIIPFPLRRKEYFEHSPNSVETESRRKVNAGRMIRMDETEESGLSQFVEAKSLEEAKQTILSNPVGRD